jgi:ABC-type branched-subunit amino acid transport system substrate-binding protein
MRPSEPHIPDRRFPNTRWCPTRPEASAGVYVWKYAFERAQSLDQEKVRDALAKTDLDTFYGHIKFAADGLLLAVLAVRQVQQLKLRQAVQ